MPQLAELIVFVNCVVCLFSFEIIVDPIGHNINFNPLR